jgi:hypothetical protein
MSPSERKSMINRDQTDLSLTKQCQLLEISRSSLYYVPVGVNAKPLELMNEIDRVFTKYPFFGSRQIAAYCSVTNYTGVVPNKWDLIPEDVRSPTLFPNGNCYPANALFTSGRFHQL